MRGMSGEPASSSQAAQKVTALGYEDISRRCRALAVLWVLRRFGHAAGPELRDCAVRPGCGHVWRLHRHQNRRRSMRRTVRANGVRRHEEDACAMRKTLSRQRSPQTVSVKSKSVATNEPEPSS